MVTYPVRIPRKHYRGSKSNIRQKVDEQNRIACELEKYINEKIEKQAHEFHSYLYYEIASETGYDLKTVEEILFSVDCGNNGFTVCKPKSEV